MIAYRRNKPDLHVGDILYLKMIPDGYPSEHFDGVPAGFSIYVLVEVLDTERKLSGEITKVEVKAVAGDAATIWIQPWMLWEKVVR